MNKTVCTIALIICLLLVGGCRRQETVTSVAGSKKLVVVTTLFPLYDFTRSIGGDKVEVILLLPPGMEAHSFQPKPDDALRVSTADIFIYTNQFMEPWAVNFARNLASGKLSLVDSSSGVTFLKSGQADDSGAGRGIEHHEHGSGMDPHIWLDFSNARTMVRTIAAALIAKDPAHRAYYAANETALVARLAKLDDEFDRGLSNCRKKTLLHGGHYAFGYLAHRYGLQYESAAAVNADAEPTPATIIGLVKKVKALGIRHVFSEELLSPRVSEMIAREAGVSVLALHGAHNISREDFNAGTTFIDLMSRNLDNLKIGLQCNE